MDMFKKSPRSRQNVAEKIAEELYFWKDFAFRLWNGERPNDAVTRYEVTQIIKRVFGWREKPFNEAAIWNGSRAGDAVSEHELAVMIGRAKKFLG